MCDLKIEIVARDELGSIVALVTPHGVVDARTASAEIASGRARYVAGPDSYVRAPIKAIAASGGAYLYANWDGSRRNNLHDLATIDRRPATRSAVRTASGRSERAALPRRSTFWSTIFRAFGLD
ncbi:hypothetical protein ACFVWR_01720 [Leifsonia sp. NPDC058292]|uniref:hypothetical protein n=1 Tax=Leifsonia sp. NPDC058292 TaxID=3346428 RepID=UPI0036DC7EC0